MAKTTKMGRPPWNPTAKQREDIKKLAAIGTPEEYIAEIMDVNFETLKKHCQTELTKGKIEGGVRALNSRAKQIDKGNMAAIKHYLAVTHGIIERQSVENTGENGGPLIVKWMD